MGYELRVERPAPLAFAELATVLGQAGFEFRGSQEAGEVLARHGDGIHAVADWNGQSVGHAGVRLAGGPDGTGGRPAGRAPGR